MCKIKDVAKIAGVSPMTVSRVMNGQNNVKEDTKEKVFKAVKQLNYRPNLIARSLITSRTSTIGLMLPNISNPLFAEILDGVNAYAHEANYNIILCSANNKEDMIEGITTLINKQVDGLILMPVEFRSKDETEGSYNEVMREISSFYKKFEVLAKDLKEQNRSVVIFENRGFDGDVIRVSVDYRAGAKMAVKYLSSLGHKRIGYIRHLKDYYLWHERNEGFFEGMRNCGLVVDNELVVPSLDTVHSAYEAMESLLKKENRPSAVYCANDTIAAGALQAAIANGLRVPNDISIIGHDGSIIGNWTVPKLTTVSIQPRIAGELCAKVLISNILGKDEAYNIVIPPKVIEGESTGLLI